MHARTETPRAEQHEGCVSRMAAGCGFRPAGLQTAARPGFISISLSSSGASRSSMCRTCALRLPCKTCPRGLRCSIVRKLVICNDRFAQLYDLPPEMIRPGTHIEEMLKHRVANGNIGPD